MPVAADIPPIIVSAKHPRARGDRQSQNRQIRLDRPISFSPGPTATKRLIAE